MDANFFGMYTGMVDPWKCLEMQAKYLRLLADMYADAPSSVDTTASSPAVQTAALIPKPHKEFAKAPAEPSPSLSNQTSTRPLSPSHSQPKIVPDVQKPQSEVIAFSPPKVRPQTAAEPVMRSRKVIDFDEIPVSGTGKDFNAIVEKALREDRSEAVRPAESVRTHDFLKKRNRAVSVSRSRVAESQELPESPARRSETPRREPKEFLKRGNGQLCINPKALKSESKDTPNESFVSQKSSQNVPPRMKTAPKKLQSKPVKLEDDSEMVKRLKKQVADATQSKAALQEECKASRLEEEALVEEVEGMKQDMVKSHMERFKEEIDSKRREEVTRIQKERRVLLKVVRGSQVDEAEELKILVKTLQDEAQKQESEFKAEIEVLKASIRKAKPLPWSGSAPKYSVAATKATTPTTKAAGLTTTLKVSTPSAAPLSAKSTSELKAIPKENPEPSSKPAKGGEVLLNKSGTLKKKQEAVLETKVVEVSSEEEFEEEEGMASQHDLLKCDENDVSLRVIPPDNSRLLSTNKTPDGKIQKTYESGRKEFLFSDGVRKEVFPDGFMVVYFANQDIKQVFPTGEMVYYFKETDTTQTTYPDGMLKFKFPSGQTEKHYPDGTKEVAFADGTVKCIFPDGEEESLFPDGTVQKRDAKGVKYIDFASGQRDTIFPDGSKLRMYPDGSTQRFLPDGSPC